MLTDTRSVTTSRRSQQDAADRHYGGESGHLQAKQRDAEPPGALALLTAWDTLDLDGSGRLSAVEAAGLKTVLNIDWNIEQAWEEATRLEGGKWTAPETDHEQLQPTAIGHPDPRQHSVEISFGSFAQVYNTRMGARRRQRRLEVKAVFDKLDKDHIGALNKQQIDVLVRRCSKQLALLPPAFELDRDWSWLTSESKPTDPSDPTAVDVPWLHFERWWKNRCGLTEASSPIIPEYFARCSATLADAKPGGQDGDGRATKSKRWRYLVPRLQLLGQMSSNWALNVEKPDGIAISTESVYESNPIPPGIRDPDSIFSAVWDVVQVMFLLYVSITVPYRACFEIEVTLFSLTWFWDTMIDLYFLTDMLLNFRTAYTDADGIRQVDPRKIAANYFKGWFVLDFISCIPVSHISMMSAQTSQATHGMSEEATSDNMRALKAIRLLRMSKMLRLARIKRILQKYESLMAVQEYISVGFAIASIVFLAHFLSCLWYLVGLTNQTVLAGRAIELGRPGVWQDPRATTVLSWVNEQPWFEQNSTKLKAMVGTRYIASMYFVFNALDGYGQTDNERMVGVVALVFTIVIKGFIAGIMSSMLISLGGKDQEMNDALRRINSWVSESRVPGSLTKQCLDYFRHHLKNRARTSDAEALSYMPPSMRVQFREHIYGEHLNRIPIFRGLSGEIMAAIRAEMTPMVAIKGQIIYEEGSVGSELCTRASQNILCAVCLAHNYRCLVIDSSICCCLVEQTSS